MDIDIRAESVHGDEPKIASKVARIEPREREAVSKACHRRVKVARLEVLIDVLALHRRVHVSPYERDRAARYAAALVRDFDRDVLFALHDDDLDGRDHVLLVVAVSLDDRAERILEELEADVRQVAWHVRKMQVLRADQLDGRTLEHPVMFLADESRVLYRLVDNVMHILICTRQRAYQTVWRKKCAATYGTCTYDPDVVWVGRQGIERHVYVM